MGLMGRILGARAAARQVGGAVGGVAEIFVGNRAERDAAAAKTLDAVVEPVRDRVRRAVAWPVRPLRERAEPAAAADPGVRNGVALRLCHGRAGGLLDPNAGPGAGARPALVAARRHRLVLLRRPRAAPPAQPRRAHRDPRRPRDARPGRRRPPRTRPPPTRRRCRWPAPARSTPTSTPRSRSGAASAAEQSARGRAGGPVRLGLHPPGFRRIVPAAIAGSRHDRGAGAPRPDPRLPRRRRADDRADGRRGPRLGRLDAAGGAGGRRAVRPHARGVPGADVGLRGLGLLGAAGRGELALGEAAASTRSAAPGATTRARCCSGCSS